MYKLCLCQGMVPRIDSTASYGSAVVYLQHKIPSRGDHLGMLLASALLVYRIGVQLRGYSAWV